MPPYRVIHLTIQIGKGVIFLFQVGCSALLVQFKRRAYKNMKKMKIIFFHVKIA